MSLAHPQRYLPPAPAPAQAVPMMSYCNPSRLYSFTRVSVIGCLPLGLVSVR